MKPLPVSKNLGRKLAATAKKMVAESTKTQPKKKLAATVDATPSWESLTQLFIEWIQSGTSEQHTDATENLFRMAKISDAYKELVKDGKVLASNDTYEALKILVVECEAEIKAGRCSKKIFAMSVAKDAIAKAEGKK
jgi:hypothetical protein